MKFEVPLLVKIGLLVVGTTLMYTYIGQLVPQKQVFPPEVIELPDDMSPGELAEVGQTIFQGKGLCQTCHTIGKSGALRFPDLGNIASRAATQVDGLDELQYLAQSLYEPDAYIVPGYNPVMPAMDKPPIALTDPEIMAVIAYLQTLGGEPTVTLETELGYGGGS